MKSMYILVILLASFMLSLNTQSSYVDPYLGYMGTDSALQFWKLAAISYCSSDDIDSWDCGATSEFPGFQNITVLQGSILYGTQAYIGYLPSQNQIIISFKGSNTIQNWVENFDFTLTPISLNSSTCNNCQVHEGFLNSYLNLKDGMIDQVQSLTTEYPTAHISITGHSLGAAMATYLFVDLNDEGYPVNNFITFGCPRTGNSEWADFIDNTLGYTGFVSRLVHYEDPVPHLPFMSLGYQHINTEVWYTSDTNNNYETCIQNEDPTCSDSISFIDTDVFNHDRYFNINRHGLIGEDNILSTN